MRYLFLILCSAVFSCLLMAEEEKSSQASSPFFGLEEISAPLSFYSENLDPKEKVLLLLSEEQRVEEKGLIVDFDEAINSTGTSHAIVSTNGASITLYCAF